VAALFEARRGGHVVVRAHRHHQVVGVVGAGVGRHPPGARVDLGDRLLAEVHTVLGDGGVRKPDGVGGLTAHHHLELGEAEVERVVAVDQRDVDRVRDRLRQPGGQLQSREAGTQDQNVSFHRVQRP
jgi:hypothetical protein